jgi:lipoprotein NlpD
VGRFSNKDTPNKGIDIAGKYGSSITATTAGRVVYTGDALTGYGNLIIIKHTDNFLSAYAHNERILVMEQQWIKSGQQIATMGNHSDKGTPLHFEIRYKGKAVDPLRYLK